MKSVNKLELYLPQCNKMFNVVKVTTNLSLIRSVVLNRQNVVFVYDLNAIYFSKDQLTTLGVDWVNKLSWLQTNNKISAINLVVFCSYNMVLVNEVVTKLSIPVLVLYKLNMFNVMDEMGLYKLVSRYLHQFNLKVKVFPLNKTKNLTISRKITKFSNSVYKLKKLLGVSNYPFKVNTGSTKKRRARITARLPKP